MFIRAAADELVVPDNFVDGKRHVLLGLKRDDPLDLFFINRWQFYESGKHRLTGNGVIDVATLDLEFVQRLSDHRPQMRVANPFSGAVGDALVQTKIVQHKSAASLRTKLAERDGLRAEVKGKDAVGGRHVL